MLHTSNIYLKKKILNRTERSKDDYKVKWVKYKVQIHRQWSTFSQNQYHDVGKVNDIFKDGVRTSIVKAALLIKVKSFYPLVTFLRKIKRVLLKFHPCNNRAKKKEKLRYIETNIIMYDAQKARSRINEENLKHDDEITQEEE